MTNDRKPPGPSIEPAIGSVVGPAINAAAERASDRAGTPEQPKAVPLGTNPGDPLPRLPAHVSHGRFERVLRAGHFALTTEIAPPDSADPDEVLSRARLFDGHVDAINATDGSGANCHMSSLAVCAILTRAGYSPIIQISCRDRNRIAIQGDVLGGAALGVGNVLCLTGDDVSAGDHPEAKPVFDLDCISLLQTIKTMRDHSRFQSGRELSAPPKLFMGATLNPFAPPYESRADHFAKKVAAGAQFAQSQYCFDIDLLRSFMARARDLGLTERCFILIGVGVLGSAKTARWLRSAVPGVHIPDAIIARLEGAKNERKEGRKICTEFMQQISQIDGISGIHLMAYRQENWVGEIVQRSGVLGTRKPWAPEHTTKLRQPPLAPHSFDNSTTSPEPGAGPEQTMKETRAISEVHVLQKH